MKGKVYWRWGLTAFLTVCAILVFYDAFYQGGTLQHILGKLAEVLAPVFYGLAMAYLLTPLVKWFERGILWCIGKCKGLRDKKLKRGKGLLRAAAILLTWAVVLAMLYWLMSVLIPQLIESVTMLIRNARYYYYKVYRWVDTWLAANPEIGSWANDVVTEYYNNALNTLTDTILPKAQELATALTGGIWTGIRSLVTFAMNLIVGIIISVYLLAMKEKSLARCCKMIYATFQQEKAELILTGLHNTNQVFSGFVRGKLLDSLIIGILCFIGCSILKMPYTPAGQRGGGRHQCDPLLRAVSGRHSQRVPDPAGEPAEVSVFHHFHYPAPAAGRQCDRPENPGRQHRHFQLLGHCCHSGGRRLLRRAGHVLRRAGVRLSADAGEVADGSPPDTARHAHRGQRLRGAQGSAAAIPRCRSCG